MIIGVAIGIVATIALAVVGPYLWRGFQYARLGWAMRGIGTGRWLLYTGTVFAIGVVVGWNARFLFLRAW